MNIFTGEDRKALLAKLSAGIKTKNGGTKGRAWWVLPAQVVGTLLLVFLLGYLVVFQNIQKVVETSSSNFHWLHGFGGGVISFILAAVATWPIYISLGKAFIWKLNQKDLMVLGTSVALVLASAYGDRNKFFAKGTASKELCPALLRGDKPSIKLLGQGSDEGLKCIPLSREDAALALSIDRSVWAKEIVPVSMTELEALVPYDRGAVAIYIGYAKSGDPKIYDGPDFNPRALGVLKPITEDELISYKVTQRANLLLLENAKNREKEAAAKAAAILAEQQRAAAEAEARRLQQERLAAEAAEERRITATREAAERAKREAEAKSKARSEWWTGLFIFVGMLVVLTIAGGPIGFVVGLILLLYHFSNF